MKPTVMVRIFTKDRPTSVWVFWLKAFRMINNQTYFKFLRILKRLLLRSTLPRSMVRCWPITEFLWISSAFFTTFHVNWLNTCKTFCLVLSYLPVLLWKVFNQYLFVFLVFIAYNLVIFWLNKDVMLTSKRY